MKLTKKLVALSLAIAMIVGLCSFSSSSDEITPFKIGISRLEMRDSTELSSYGTYFIYDGQEINLADIGNNFAILVDWNFEQGCYVIQHSLGSGADKSAWDIPDTGFVLTISNYNMLAFDLKNRTTILGGAVATPADDSDDEILPCGAFAAEDDLAGQPLYLYGCDPVLGTLETIGAEYTWTRYVPDEAHPYDKELNLAASDDVFESSGYVMIGAEDEEAEEPLFTSYNAKITKLPAIGAASYYKSIYGFQLSHYYPYTGLYSEALSTTDDDDIYDECFFIDTEKFSTASEFSEYLGLITFAYSAVLEMQDNGYYKVIKTNKWDLKTEWAYEYFAVDPEDGDSALRSDRILLCAMIQNYDKPDYYGCLTFEFGHNNWRTPYYCFAAGENPEPGAETGFITGWYALFENVDSVSHTVKTYGDWGTPEFASDSWVYFAEEPVATKRTDERYTKVYRSETTPVIDGAIGENEYTLVSNDTCWKYKDNDAKTATNAEKKVYATYDDTNLYLAASMSRDSHVNNWIVNLEDDISGTKVINELTRGNNASFSVISADPESDEIRNIVNQEDYNLDKAIASAAARKVTLALTDDYYYKMYMTGIDYAGGAGFNDSCAANNVLLSGTFQVAGVDFTRVAASDDSYTVGDNVITSGYPTINEDTKQLTDTYPHALFAVSSNGNTGAIKGENGYEKLSENPMPEEDQLEGIEEYIYKTDDTDNESNLDVYEIALPWSWIDYKTDAAGNAGDYETNGVLNVRQQQLQLGTRTIDGSDWNLADGAENAATEPSNKTVDGTYFGLAASISNTSVCPTAPEESDDPDYDPAYEQFGYDLEYIANLYGETDTITGTAYFYAHDFSEFGTYRKMYLAGFVPEFVERDLTDEETGINLKGATVEKHGELQVTKLDNTDTDYSLFSETIEAGDQVGFYDVVLNNYAGDVAFQGNVTLTLPAADYEDDTELTFAHLVNGAVVTETVKVADGKVTLTLASLGKIALVAASEDYTQQTLTDEATGISVTGDKVYKNAKLVVKALTDADASWEFFKDYVADGKLVGYYDISLVNEDNEKVPFVGNLTVKFDLTESAYADEKAINIGHYVNSKLDKISTKVSANAVSTIVTALSPFVVIDPEATGSNNTTTTTTTTANGDSTTTTAKAANTTTKPGSSNGSSPVTSDNIVNLVLLGIMSLAGITALEIKKKKSSRV